MMREALTWSLDVIASIEWLEVIRTAAPVIIAMIAFRALKTWQRQDKAKRAVEFLDQLIEATHAYIVECSGQSNFFISLRLEWRAM